MVVARKSDVSAKGTWFQRHFTLPLRKRRFARQGSAARSASTTAEAAPVASKQRRLSKNLSVSSTNKAVIPTSMKELGRQQASNLNGASATPKSLKENFIGVPVMPSSKSAPLWLLRLYTLHRYSSVVAFLFVAATLVVYGWTVYSQELWSQTYRRVQNLQRHERLLTTTNATLKNKMAEEAERPTAGLVSPTPEGTIFLSPAPQSPNPESSTTTPNSETQQQTLSPLGY
ncbi:hypothetical protein FNW02_25915 [Komarekiella sp. 'clone 1']|uniref:Cell division protein FtsL n=1 Tax=Komarekiella delphini-convector SJRDD-AB1 TaxID=2593771 RepID=A0AA40T1W2_9NOST|nr:hypothetical protein [Komarekiella delphini-convector]MBD6619168.1 hypothetical protein [Komarekiella delphini-convector SJRDD-AB1]